jgi:hypothetical protein
MIKYQEFSLSSIKNKKWFWCLFAASLIYVFAFTLTSLLVEAKVQFKIPVPLILITINILYGIVGLYHLFYHDRKGKLEDDPSLARFAGLLLAICPFACVIVDSIKTLLVELLENQPKTFSAIGAILTVLILCLIFHFLKELKKEIRESNTTN